MKSIVCTIATLLLSAMIIWGSHPCYGQPASPPIQDGEAIQVREVPPQIIERMKTQMEQQRIQLESESKTACQQYYAMTIDDLDRACGLSAAQQKKLQLAAKGSVAATLRKWKNTNERTRQGMQKDLKEMKEMGEGGDAFGGNMPAEIMMVGGFPGGRGGGGSLADTKQFANLPLWKKSLSKVLTLEQKKAYQDATAARHRFKRGASIDIFLARIDMLLLLSSSQRKEMHTLISDSLGKRFETVEDKSIYNFVPPMPSTHARRLPEKQLQGILTATQYKNWQNYREKYASSKQEQPNGISIGEHGVELSFGDENGVMFIEGGLIMGGLRPDEPKDTEEKK